VGKEEQGGGERGEACAKEADGAMESSNGGKEEDAARAD
jgi:hypothetical protein